MADIIKCPSCGQNNPADQEFCQFCRARLQPLAGPSKGTDASIKPGQFPTKKNTAELEPILPQWLRDARDSARKSAEDDAVQAAKQAQTAPPASSTPDLLAGLHAQVDNDEDETPDWLASITGNAPKSKKAQAESSEVRWVELGDAKDFAKDEPSAESKKSDWLAELNAAESKADDKNELTDWFQAASNTNAAAQPVKPGPFDTTLPDDGTADWLKQMAADGTQDEGSLFNDSNEPFKAPASNDNLDWLHQMAVDDGDKSNEAPFNDLNEAKSNFDPLAADTPSWLEQTPGQNDIKNSNASSSADSSIDTPDWLRSMGGTQEEQPQNIAPADFSGSGFGGSDAFTAVSSDENVPEWLKGLPSEEKDQSMKGPVPTWLKEESSSADAELPSWLSSKPAQAEPAAPESEPFSMDDQPDLGGDVPSWLQAAAPQSSVYDVPSSEPEESPVSTSSDTPDWLNAFKSIDAPPPTPAFSIDEPIESAPAAFTTNSSAGKNEEALFADMPDWLSNIPEASPNRTSIGSSDAIAPGELPSWVQAMRPVDTGPSRPSSSSTDQTLESRGALAGLQGVLPSVPGFAPTSKPKAYSIKLQASDEQQSHAQLLEQILAAETEPVPIASFSALRTSRSLRWGLSAVFLTVLSIVLLSGIQIFSMPTDLPNEIATAKQVAQSIPEGAAVLVTFDYQPARVGEMQAAAAQIFSLMRKPSLTVISTNETGALLAERFASGPFAGINSDGGISYLNLGYLPGGQMGIREFAQNPSAAMPALTGFSSFSQFAAFIIITDDADDARIWIEQTSSTRGALPIVVISSAQAAPMIQPYYESQQILGLVSGLYGGAVLETNNGAGSGAARTYWDAFSIGMLLAMIFILLGGLVNLALGLRDRAAAREEK